MHLRGNVVGRRTLFKGAISGVTADCPDRHPSSVRSGHRFCRHRPRDGRRRVPGERRHLSFGDDPTTEMWVGGQLFNLKPSTTPSPPVPSGVLLDYGTGPGYGSTVNWSRARYRDYGFIALDVVPAPRGQ